MTERDSLETFDYNPNYIEVKPQSSRFKVMAKFFTPALALAFVAGACKEAVEIRQDTPTPIENSSNAINIDPTCTFIEDELIVKFKEDKPTDEVQKILDQYEAQRIRPDLNLGGAWTLKVPEENRDNLEQALDQNQGVEYAERNPYDNLYDGLCTPTVPSTNP